MKKLLLTLMTVASLNACANEAYALPKLPSLDALPTLPSKPVISSLPSEKELWDINAKNAFDQFDKTWTDGTEETAKKAVRACKDTLYIEYNSLGNNRERYPEHNMTSMFKFNDHVKVNVFYVVSTKTFGCIAHE